MYIQCNVVYEQPPCPTSDNWVFFGSRKPPWILSILEEAGLKLISSVHSHQLTSSSASQFSSTGGPPAPYLDAFILDLFPPVLARKARAFQQKGKGPSCFSALARHLPHLPHSAWKIPLQPFSRVEHRLETGRRRL